MPELPEMENYRTLLEQQIVNRTISDIQINREKSINVPIENFRQKVIGQHVNSIGRRGKQLIFELENGYRLLLHLMLGGILYVGTEEDQPKRTKQIIFDFGKKELFFIGLRLGYLHLLTETELKEELEKLGPEPFDPAFTLEKFLSMVKGKRGMLKTTLLDQKFIAGIGNCYSDEICYDAHLLPMKKCNELSAKQQENIYFSIRKVLKRAFQLGGYMDLPLYKQDNLTGGYNDNCLVYDREGEQCHRCGNTIIKEEISSRKCFFCPECQE
jgi:formamidopyrimidine-DNA glycosylase